jgi:hypothetical protein
LIRGSTSFPIVTVRIASVDGVEVLAWRAVAVPCATTST